MDDQVAWCQFQRKIVRGQVARLELLAAFDAQWRGPIEGQLDDGVVGVQGRHARPVAVSHRLELAFEHVAWGEGLRSRHGKDEPP